MRTEPSTSWIWIVGPSGLEQWQPQTIGKAMQTPTAMSTERTSWHGSVNWRMTRQPLPSLSRRRGFFSCWNVPLRYFFLRAACYAAIIGDAANASLIRQVIDEKDDDQN
jgi:hypothetical protein